MKSVPRINNGFGIYNGGPVAESMGSVEILDEDYETIGIGGIIITARNLDVKFPGIYIASDHPELPSAWYYDNDELAHGKNGDQWGLLYNYWCKDIIESNIPSGWRLPTKSDLDIINSIDPKILTLFTNSHTNELGFNAPPSGYTYGNRNTDFHGGTTEFRMWSTTDEVLHGPEYVWCYYVQTANNHSVTNMYKDFGGAVRLVHDLV